MTIDDAVRKLATDLVADWLDTHYRTCTPERRPLTIDAVDIHTLADLCGVEDDDGDYGAKVDAWADKVSAGPLLQEEIELALQEARNADVP